DRDGRRIATASVDGTIRVWNADGSGEPVIFRGHEGNGVWWPPAWAPDGRRIATVRSDATVRVWNADGSGEPVILRGHDGVLKSPLWSPDGRRILTISDPNTRGVSTARVWFADGSSLQGNQYETLRNALPLYDATRIETLDWQGINLRVESQGPDKNPLSIQARVIAQLRQRDFSVIFDDDGKGEAADIVAIRSVDEAGEQSQIEVELYHCKFAHGGVPERRIDDLYEVCGQAQKSIAWASSADKKTELFTHLLRRDALRVQRNQATRLEVGTKEDLLTLRDMSRLLPVAFKIFIAQPGLCKRNPAPEQLSLLSVTQNYLWETYQIPFGVIASLDVRTGLDERQARQAP
ncbi:hypothetical protein FBQ96_16840, partial [Nitrospirales bacterium NOB]|nr:hypothetical protein [Nitrospirales bacterium NOB]